MARSSHTLRLVAIAMAVSGIAASHVVAAVDNAAKGWGLNSYGRVGDGTTITRAAPVSVVGLSSKVDAVAGGFIHSLAIQNGAVKAWGNNQQGQLGNGTLTNSTVPVSVTGLTSGVTGIAGGAYFSMAIQNNAVLTWGDNSFGQLGNGTTITSKTPVAVTGLTSGVTAVAGGGFHSMAIQNGAAKTWGYNEYGQLGNNTGGLGSGSTSKVPVSVTGLTSGVTAIAAGGYHSLAVQNGAAKAWGYNLHGELGDGTTTDRKVPITVSGLTSGVTAVAGGYTHSLAIQNGNVYAWGSNASGSLGNNSTTDSTTPVLSLDLGVDLIAVAASYNSSYALAADGDLWVWGKNSLGQLGLGDTTNRLTPTKLQAPSGYIYTSVDTDTNDHVLATLSAKPVYFPGDATGDNVTNFDDLIILAQHYNQTSGNTYATGDFTGEGAVNFDDLIILAQHYNTSASGLAAADLAPAFSNDWALAQSLVPEPTATLAAVAIGWLGACRRRP